ncbi:MAG TPA: hypothetical protein VME17_09665 [Bryobacteraceae bacterium]|nr:hypothetical protein [Bryobacteraceae bacterium]
MAQGSLTQPAASGTPSAASFGRGNLLRGILAGLFIAGSFLFFTWRGLLVYYTGDDMMNLYGYLSKPVSALIKANFFFWTPYYRPFGGVVYRSLYGIFGFNPYPMYVVFFAALLVNIWLAYLVLSRIGGSREIGAIAALVFSFHGKLDYLYYNAGSMYDAFCFLFYFSALLIYLKARLQKRLLGAWETAGFLACFICALNSKEMAATLPVMLAIYELLFHPPDFRSLRALWRWCLHEGRMAMVSALCVLIYIPAKLGPQGLTTSDAYVPHYNLHQYLLDTGIYLADLLYRNSRPVPLGVIPLTPLTVGAIFAAFAALALWMRSRAMCFGLLFFVIGLLPVSFVEPRLGFVLYLPLAGMALYAAVCVVRIKDRLRSLIPAFGSVSPAAVSVGLFVVMATIMSVINYKHWPKAPNPRFSPYKQAAAEFPRLVPHLRHGAKLLFVHSNLDYNWDLVFVLRILYRDNDLFITMLNGPPAQRIPLKQLGHYDHIFTFEDGHYIELDNSDAYRTVVENLRKEAHPSVALGESCTIGKPGAAQYLVKGVQVGPPNQTGYWTLDDPELRFQLSSTGHHWYMERFFVPRETLQKTGPLHVDFYVNGHLLDQAVFPKDGETLYQHDVPASWLSTEGFTTVKMLVHNPYISPPYGDRLGVVLLHASFNPVPKLPN